MSWDRDPERVRSYLLSALMGIIEGARCTMKAVRGLDRDFDTYVRDARAWLAEAIRELSEAEIIHASRGSVPDRAPDTREER